VALLQKGSRAFAPASGQMCGAPKRNGFEEERGQNEGSDSYATPTKLWECGASERTARASKRTSMINPPPGRAVASSFAW
jgi:hypothetical protein